MFRECSGCYQYAVSYTHLDVYKRQIQNIPWTFRAYVLDKLQKGGLTVNWDKSKFLQTEIHFLGFIISQEGILADPDKVEAIRRFPDPKNI